MNQSCCCCNKDKTNNNCCEDNCIAEILQIIYVLQTNACPDGCLNSCDRPALGGGTNCIVCNTRPIVLYTCGTTGTPLSMPISRTTTETETSSVFRIEKLNGCCATFRVLRTNPDTSSTLPFVGTDSIFTIDINCLCAVRCLNDTFVECI